MPFPREVARFDFERREVHFTNGARLLGIFMMLFAWPLFCGVLWFAAHVGTWLR